MKNELKIEMSKKSDDQLITIVTAAKGTYAPELVKAAESEGDRRNLVIDMGKVGHAVASSPEVQAGLLRKSKNYDKDGDLTSVGVQVEILLTQRLVLEKLEKIRENTSYLVWWLVVVPIVVGIIAAFIFLI